MELSRKEVLDIYNYFKNVNLKGMSANTKKAIVLNCIRLKPIAEAITEENTSVVEQYATEEYKQALAKFLTAKQKFESIEAPTAEDIKQYKLAEKEFGPMFSAMEKDVNDAIKELTQTYDVEIMKLPMEEFFESMDTALDKYSFQSTIEIISKLLE